MWFPRNSFIDEKNNMYILNDKYSERKEICNDLFQKYMSDDFIWCNQSYTQIANASFKQMNGFLPKSLHNERTRNLLDDFYPKAIPWCSGQENIPDDCVNIDICR